MQKPVLIKPSIQDFGKYFPSFLSRAIIISVFTMLLHSIYYRLNGWDFNLIKPIKDAESISFFQKMLFSMNSMAFDSSPLEMYLPYLTIIFVMLSWILPKKSNWVIANILWAVFLFLLFHRFKSLWPLGGQSQLFENFSPSDQGYYYLMAKEILNGTLKSTDYLYGLGYPVLGILFYKLFHGSPFEYLNLFCFISTAIFTVKIANKLTGSLLISIVATLIFMSQSIIVAEQFVMPWSSTVVVAAYSYTIYTLLFNRPTLYSVLFLGVATGISFAARYVDAILWLPFWLYLFVSSIRSRDKQQIAIFILGALCAAVFVAGTLYSHSYYFGSILETPYRYHGRPEGGSDQSLGTYLLRLGLPQFFHLYGTIVDASSSILIENGANPLKPVLFSNFLFIFAPSGILLFLQNFKGRYMLGGLVSLAVGLLFFLFIYGAHPGSCAGCLIFGSKHYFKPLHPILFAFSLYFVTQYIWGEMKQKQFAKHIVSVLVSLTALTLASYYLTPTSAKIEVARNVGDESTEFKIIPINKFGTTLPRFSLTEHIPKVILDGSLVDSREFTQEIPVTVQGSYFRTEWKGVLSKKDFPNLKGPKLKSYWSTTISPKFEL